MSSSLPPLVGAQKPDMPHCPKCGVDLVSNQSIIQLPNLPIVMAVAWCTECKHLLTLQFLTTGPMPRPN
jgi:hypothetical protein